MKKIIAFGASSSIHSINKKFATYAAYCVPNAQVTILDLNDYEMPIFSVDRQNNDGFPQPAHDFKDLIMSSDGIIISFAEHNSSYSAAFKNIFDWISRFKGDIWYSKPMLLLATNDGDRGAKTVLEYTLACLASVCFVCFVVLSSTSLCLAMLGFFLCFSLPRAFYEHASSF